jgi:hypothetical protein
LHPQIARLQRQCNMLQCENDRLQSVVDRVHKELALALASPPPNVQVQTPAPAQAPAQISQALAQAIEPILPISPPPPIQRAKNILFLARTHPEAFNDLYFPNKRQHTPPPPLP